MIFQTHGKRTAQHADVSGRPSCIVRHGSFRDRIFKQFPYGQLEDPSSSFKASPKILILKKIKVTKCNQINLIKNHKDMTNKTFYTTNFETLILINISHR